MFIVSLYRVCKFAWQGFWRNFWLSVVTISIIVLASLTVNALIVLNVIADSVVQSLEQKIDVSIYFDPEVPEERIREVKDYLGSLAQVTAIRYTSADEALRQFRRRHSKDPAILESLETLKKNPLGGTLAVTARKPDDYQEIIAILNRSPHRDLVEEENFTDHRQTIREINAIANRINQTGITVTVVFVAIAMLIVFNTIRVAIYTHREEIAIMKLVGASNTFITAPFVIESILYAVVAAALTLLITFPLLNTLQPLLENFFTGIPLDLTAYFRRHGLEIFILQAGGIVTLNIIGSAIAIRRYLKV